MPREVQDDFDDRCDTMCNHRSRCDYLLTLAQVFYDEQIVWECLSSINQQKINVALEIYGNTHKDCCVNAKDPENISSILFLKNFYKEPYPRWLMWICDDDGPICG